MSAVTPLRILLSLRATPFGMPIMCRSLGVRSSAVLTIREMIIDEPVRIACRASRIAIDRKGILRGRPNRGAAWSNRLLMAGLSAHPMARAICCALVSLLAIRTRLAAVPDP